MSDIIQVSDVIEGNPSRYTVGRIVVLSYLLDAISATESVAYSTRKLSASYAGSALRVRETGTGSNNESDIGFTAAGLLDTTALTNFVTSSGAFPTANGFVTKWYDQSGNGFDLAQATAANQPRIVNAGAIETINSNPAIRFIRANTTTLTNAGTLASVISATQWTCLQTVNIVSSVFTIIAGEAAEAVWGEQNNNIISLGTGTSGGNLIFYTHCFTTVDNAILSPTISLATNYLGIGRYNSPTLKQWINGTDSGGSSTGGSIPLSGATQTIGVDSPAAGRQHYLDGLVSEIIWFKTPLVSADMNTLAAGSNIAAGGNMTTYGGTSWSTIP